MIPASPTRIQPLLPKKTRTVLLSQLSPFLPRWTCIATIVSVAGLEEWTSLDRNFDFFTPSFSSSLRYDQPVCHTPSSNPRPPNRHITALLPTSHLLGSDLLLGSHWESENCYWSRGKRDDLHNMSMRERNTMDGESQRKRWKWIYYFRLMFLYLPLPHQLCQLLASFDSIMSMLAMPMTMDGENPGEN
jgi:hypothetical protein